MRQLYRIREEFLQAVALLQNATTPEEEAAAHEAVANLAEDFETKIENIRKVIINMEDDIRVIEAHESWHKDELDRLEGRKDSVNSEIDKLKAYTMREMKQADVRKVKTPFCTVWVQASAKKLNVIDDSKIPVKFYIPQAPKLDKTALKNYIESGNAIEGVVITQSESLRFDKKKENDDE